MRLRICLATPDRELSDFFGRLKDAVAPRESLARGYYASRGASIRTSSFMPEVNPTVDDLATFLIGEAGDATDFILLLDVRWQYLVTDVSATIFPMLLDSSLAGSSLLNFLRKNVTYALRIYGTLAAKFQDGGDAKLLGLPLRNFKANELTELAELCSAGIYSQDFNNELDRYLSLLRKRVRPRRNSSFKTKYAVDEEKRFFPYGNERHALPETGGDHKPHCELAAHFRFGHRIDAGRHYNVSETEGDKTSIQGTFLNCHSAMAWEARETHLNMFSNDMYY